MNMMSDKHDLLSRGGQCSAGHAASGLSNCVYASDVCVRHVATKPTCTTSASAKMAADRATAAQRSIER